MANTKKLSKDERKKLKRAGRKSLKTLQRALTSKQQKEFKKANKGLRVFTAALAAKASTESN